MCRLFFNTKTVDEKSKENMTKIFKSWAKSQTDGFGMIADGLGYKTHDSDKWLLLNEKTMCHFRRSSAGVKADRNAHPFIIGERAYCHNGHSSTALEAKKWITFLCDERFKSETDTEGIGWLIDYVLSKEVPIKDILAFLPISNFGNVMIWDFRENKQYMIVTNYPMVHFKSKDGSIDFCATEITEEFKEFYSKKASVANVPEGVYEITDTLVPLTDVKLNYEECRKKTVKYKREVPSVALKNLLSLCDKNVNNLMRCDKFARYKYGKHFVLGTQIYHSSRGDDLPKKFVRQLKFDVLDGFTEDDLSDMWQDAYDVLNQAVYDNLLDAEQLTTIIKAFVLGIYLTTRSAYLHVPKSKQVYELIGWQRVFFGIMGINATYGIGKMTAPCVSNLEIAFLALCLKQYSMFRDYCAMVGNALVTKNYSTYGRREYEVSATSMDSASASTTDSLDLLFEPQQRNSAITRTIVKHLPSDASCINCKNNPSKCRGCVRMSEWEPDDEYANEKAFKGSLDDAVWSTVRGQVVETDIDDDWDDEEENEYDCTICVNRSKHTCIVCMDGTLFRGPEDEDTVNQKQCNYECDDCDEPTCHFSRKYKPSEDQRSMMELVYEQSENEQWDWDDSHKCYIKRAGNDAS